MVGIGLGILMTTLTVSSVNVALPTLVAELETDFPTIQWVLLSFVLVIATLMLGVARLGDMLGKKRLYASGMVIFAVSSLLCGVAPDVGWLIGFRALQGLGAVMTQALAMAIVTDIFPPSARGRALGLMGGCVSLGLALGPSLGGLLIGFAGWRSLFLVNVPVAMAAWLMVRRFIPALPPVRAGERFDVIGAAIFGLALASYALGMTFGQNWGFGDTRIIGLLIAAAAGLGVFVFAQTRFRHPMLDLRLFRNPLFGLNLLMSLLVFVALGGQILLPFFLELVGGFATYQVGFLMMVVPVMIGVVAPMAGALSDRFGSRGISVLGLLVVAAGCFAVSTLHAEVGWLGFVLRAAPFGIGMGLFQAPNNSAVMGAAPRERRGVSSGLLAFCRNMGQISGMPLWSAVFAATVWAAAGVPAGTAFEVIPHAALVAGVTRAYSGAAMVVMVAAALAIAAWIIDRRRTAGGRN